MRRFVMIALVGGAFACKDSAPRGPEATGAASTAAPAAGAPVDPATVTGIGIRPVSHPKGFAIGQVFPGGPAEGAGLQVGDVVVEVDGESTARWSLVRTARQLRGPAGTTVRMGIERGDQRLDVVVERRAVAVPPPPAR